MEYIKVDSSVFETIILQLNKLERKIGLLSNRAFFLYKKKWIDNETLCNALNISKRSLQDYRAKGLFPYTFIEKANRRTKCYYDAEEIEALLERNKVSAFKEFPKGFKF